jgi:imidazolonepropionase-like amidohydrolase
MAKLDGVTVAQRETLPEAIRRGVKVAMGTDCGVGHHGTNARELGLLVQAGMSPMGAIESATRVAAQMLGMENEIGTIEAGKAGDLIAVAADPLTNPNAIADPTTVRLVIKGGVVAKDLDGRAS